MKLLKSGSLAFLLFLIFAGSSLADLIIVANRSVPVASISKEEVKRVYLGQMSRWEDGSRVAFVLFKNEEGLNEFLSDYMGMTSMQFSQHWKKQVFTGKGQMPPMVEKARDIVEHVANTQGAIGFVPANTPSDEVKVLGINP